MVSQTKPPSATSQAAAQQAAELGATHTSAIVNNPNQVNPWGTQNYSIAGYEKVRDAKGNMIDVPRYTQTTTLSKEQQGLLNLQNSMMENLGQLGVSQSSRLQGLLGKNMDTSGVTPWQSYGKAPKLATGYGSGGSIASGFGDAGKIQTGIKGAGSGILDGYGSGGQIQKSIGDGGSIRQDSAPTNRSAIERAMMDRYNRDATSQNKQQDAQLAARGMDPGSAQYSSVQEDRDRSRTDAVNQSYLASGEESRAAQDAYNRAQEQRFGQGAVQGQFKNAAQQQAEDQAAQRAGFANAAQMQRFQQNESNAQFGNQAQSQQFQEMLARAGFGNAAQAQRNQQNQEQAAFGNTATQQNYSNSINWTDLMNNLRGAQMGEKTNLRNQPLNEIAALMSGSQVTAPQFQPFSRQGVNAAPIGQYMGQNYQAQANAAANTNAGLFGLGSSLITGGFGPGGFFR
jgi:hypothetical protein